MIGVLSAALCCKAPESLKFRLEATGSDYRKHVNVLHRYKFYLICQKGTNAMTKYCSYYYDTQHNVQLEVTHNESTKVRLGPFFSRAPALFKRKGIPSVS